MIEMQSYPFSIKESPKTFIWKVKSDKKYKIGTKITKIGAVCYKTNTLSHTRSDGKKEYIADIKGCLTFFLKSTALSLKKKEYLCIL